MFCDTKRDAIESLEVLTGLYRDRGLNLQSSKTKIMSAEEAREELANPNRVIEELDARVAETISDESEVEDPMMVEQVDSLTGQLPLMVGNTAILTQMK